MKKWIIGLLAMVALGSSAGAESFGVFLVGAGFNTYNPGKAEGFRVSARLLSGIDVQADLILGRVDGLGTKDLSLYYGAGAHAGVGLGYFGYFGGFDIGAHGVVGLEYLINPTLSIFLDFCPGISYYLNGGLTGYYGGVLGVNLKL